jgi:hypothetical protein
MATFGLKLVNSLGTFLLNSTNGITIQTPDESFISRINPIIVPRKDGALLDSSLYLEPKIITLNGIIRGTTKEAYRTYKDTFKKNLETSSLKFYIFDDRYINVQKSSCPIRDYITGLLGEFSLDFIAADPFWYATSASYTEKTTSATSYDFTTAAPAGNAPSLPTITVTADSDFTNPSVQNRSLTNLPLFSHMGSGQIWVVDYALFTATMGGSNSLSLLSGDFWDLLPGANTIRFTQDAAIEVTIRVDWTDRWY